MDTQRCYRQESGQFVHISPSAVVSFDHERVFYNFHKVCYKLGRQRQTPKAKPPQLPDCQHPLVDTVAMVTYT